MYVATKNLSQPQQHQFYGRAVSILCSMDAHVSDASNDLVGGQVGMHLSGVGHTGQEIEHHLSVPGVVVGGVSYADQLLQDLAVRANLHVSLVQLTQTAVEGTGSK